MLKSLTQHLAERLDAQRFGGAVSMPGLGMPEAEPGPAPLVRMSTVAPNSSESDSSGSVRDVLLARLLAVKPESQKLITERGGLLIEAEDLGTRIDALLEACADEQRTALSRRHREILEKGREQLTLCKQLDAEFSAANAAWNDSRLARAKASDAVHAAHHRRAHLNRWATEAQVGSADQHIETAKMQAREADRAEAAAIADRNDAEDELFTARAELRRLASEEIRLRHEISGEPFTDPELGLEKVPV